MDKLLSIIIPTYNMASLLPRCLDSLLASERVGQLEAIVVNDGSKDDSLRVARNYEVRCPESVMVIDKPNGNYGSTINAALPVAKGKYVKVLDSDDWFDTEALTQLIDSLATIDSDMVVTHFTTLGPGSNREVVRYNTMGREPYRYGRTYDLDEILVDGYIRFFLMHALTYRTALLLDMDYRQTEGISYTDTEWACYPVYQARTITFLDLNVYQYNNDREGQTMDPKVLMKCIPQIEAVTDKMLEYYESHVTEGLSATRQAFLKQYYENRMRILYKLLLFDMPRADFDVTQMQALDAKYWPICMRNDLRPVLWPENKLLRIDYIKYWHRHQKRWPVWLEKLNHSIDVVAKWVYVNLFRR